MDEESAGGRRRLIAVAVLAIAIGAVVAAVLIAQSSKSSNSSTGSSTAIQGTARVQRRNLVQTDTEAGTLSYNNPATVYNHLSGTLTSLPSVGTVIQPGGTMFRVNDQPVILMSGSVPAYRNLGPGSSDGPDIYELNANLVALGYDPDYIALDDVWQSATTAGVEAWQKALGETQNGKITLGRIVFLPGAQKIASVTGVLGASVAYHPTAPAPEFVSYETPSASTGTNPSTPTSTSTTPAAATTPSPTTPATTTTTTTPTTTGTTTTPSSSHGTPSSAQQLAALLALLRAETAQLNKKGSAGSGNPSSGTPSSGTPASGSSSPSSSGTGSSGKGSSGAGSTGSGSSNPSAGSGASPGTAVMTTTSTQLIVTVNLDASSQSEAVVGAPVQVEMPNGSNVNGRITAVSPVAVSSSSGTGNGGGGGGGGGGNGGNGGSATVPVTITLDRYVSGAGLDQAAVSVNFAKASAKNVLSVPVTALLATQGGGYAVQLAAAPHRLLPVQTGLFAAGYVQVSGPGVYSGLQVTDSQG
jgi:hypothetical protein